MTRPLIILDADGVFLSEQPYWEAALLTALSLNCVNTPAGEDWTRLSEVAFDEIGLQRVTKSRGCNSNWDLAAVLTIALRDLATKSRVEELFAGQQWTAAIQCLVASSNGLWSDRDSSRADTLSGTADPVKGFGVDRYGDDFTEVRRAFQQLLQPESGNGDWTSNALCGEPDAIKAALSQLRDLGFELAVCTGRVREELLAPMKSFGLTTFFAPDRLVTTDDVLEAEQGLKIHPLGKPHWFPVVCAAVGPALALDAVRDGRIASVPDARLVYIGDGLADFQCVDGARSVGLPIDYVHMRSGATDAEQERSIANAPFTLAVIDELADVPSLLRRVQTETPS